MADYGIAVMRLDGGSMLEERVGADNLEELNVALRTVGAVLTNEVMEHPPADANVLLEPIIMQHATLDELDWESNRAAYVKGMTVRVFSTTDQGVAYTVFIAFGPIDYVDRQVDMYRKYN